MADLNNGGAGNCLSNDSPSSLASISWSFWDSRTRREVCSMQRNYHIIVTCGYITLVVIILWTLSMPIAWRIGLLIACSVCVAIPVGVSRETVPDKGYKLPKDYEDDF
jgi:hypothetical protein